MRGHKTFCQFRQIPTAQEVVSLEEDFPETGRTAEHDFDTCQQRS
jgi:hypothetical protein